jgi:hypothetical protein
LLRKSKTTNWICEQVFLKMMMQVMMTERISIDTTMKAKDMKVVAVAVAAAAREVAETGNTK